MKVLAPVTIYFVPLSASTEATDIGWPGTSFIYATSDEIPYVS